jgi:hypothetical protein
VNHVAKIEHTSDQSQIVGMDQNIVRVEIIVNDLVPERRYERRDLPFVAIKRRRRELSSSRVRNVGEERPEF